MKIMTLSIARILAFTSLAVCVNKPKEKTQTSSSSQTTSKVMTKTSSNASLDIEDFVYFTDEEIESIKTYGDYKNFYRKINDRMVEFTTKVADQVPGERKEAYLAAIERNKARLEDTIAQTDKVYSEHGSDNTVFPKEELDSLISQMKTVRSTTEESVKGVMHRYVDGEDGQSSTNQE
jgi:hypothetical protein